MSEHQEHLQEQWQVPLGFVVAAKEPHGVWFRQFQNFVVERLGEQAGNLGEPVIIPLGPQDTEQPESERRQPLFVVAIRYPGSRAVEFGLWYDTCYDVLDAVPALRLVEPDMPWEFPEPVESDLDSAEGFGPWMASGRGSNHGDEASCEQWALRRIQLDPERTRQPELSQITIAQPDTGLIDHHTSIKHATFHPDSAGFDFYLGKPRLGDHIDRIHPDAHFKSPGHGTAVASVIVGDGHRHFDRDGYEQKAAEGVAKNAILMPIRCVEWVAVLYPSEVARAIDHATAHGADVISLSLGGFPSLALFKALKRAVENNKIVVAAAGNHAIKSTYPGSSRWTIGVAAIGADGMPWKHTCRGWNIDISAPGYRVWRAQHDDACACAGKQRKHFLVSQGDGTSFATAITAALAAHWLSVHGKPNDKHSDLHIATKTGATANEVFRNALYATASPFPRGSYTWGCGEGIVNARKLLQSGSLPKTVKLMKYSRFPKISFLGRWRFSIDESEILNYFIELFESCEEINPIVAERVAWKNPILLHEASHLCHRICFGAEGFEVSKRFKKEIGRI
jgi:hypothetical protein